MSNGVNTTFAIALRVVATLVVVLVTTFLVNSTLVPSGILGITTNFISPSPFFSYPKPSDRVIGPEDESGVISMIAHPLYVDLSPPSPFDTVSVTMKYRNTGHPSVSIGALASGLTEQYTLVPIENRLLDSLSWSKVTSGNLTLFQREQTYASLDEFFRDPPERTRLATHSTDENVPFIFDDYAPQDEGVQEEVSLRGNHRIYTYVKDEPLNFSFFVQDMNRQEGADPVILSVYRDGEVEHALTRTVLEDDGNTANDQKSSGLRKVAVSLTDAKEGVYQIEFTAPGDVFIRKIQSSQHKMVFANRVYLGDHVGFSNMTDGLTLYGDGGSYKARIPHAEAIQTITVNDSSVEVKEPHTRYLAETKGVRQLSEITTPKRNVLLESDGVFAFTKEAYFNPTAISLDWHMTEAMLDNAGVDFVLTTYATPATEDGVIVAKADFRFSEMVKTEEGAYRFVIDAEGLGIAKHELFIEAFDATLRRDPDTRPFLTRMKELLSGEVSLEQNRVVPVGTSYGESPK